MTRTVPRSSRSTEADPGERRRSTSPNTALYIRTSVADADGQAQIHALRRAAEARGWEGAKEFIDIGQSGAKASRPALDKLKKAVKAGEVRQVMVFALDRLGRSLRDLLLLLDDLNAGGCAVVSLRVIEHGDPREYGPDAVDDRDHQAVVAA